MAEPDYLVIRPSPDLPPDFYVPPHWDGRWLNRAEVPEGPPPGTPMPDGVVGAQAVVVPTGRFEVRDDGAVAEVWEIRV